MKPATELIRPGVVSGDISPLTTPIYETTTFVFENAAEVLAYNEGKSSKYLYSRYSNPTVTAVEHTIAVVEGAEAALRAVERAGGDDDRADGALLVRRRDRLQLRDLRRHAAPACRPAAEVRHPAAVRLARGAVEAGGDDFRRDEAGVVRVANQPDPALRRRRGGGPRLQGPRRDLGHRQHVREPDQPAAARARHRSGHAQRHEIPQRAQRRDRRRAGRAVPADRSDSRGAQAARDRPRPVSPPTRSAGD